MLKRQQNTNLSAKCSADVGAMSDPYGRMSRSAPKWNSKYS